MTDSGFQVVDYTDHFIPDVFQHDDKGWSTWRLVGQAYTRGEAEVHFHGRWVGFGEDEPRERCAVLNRIVADPQLPVAFQPGDRSFFEVLDTEGGEMDLLMFVGIAEVAESGQEFTTPVRSVARLRGLDRCDHAVAQPVEPVSLDGSFPVRVGIDDWKLEAAGFGGRVPVNAHGESIDKVVERVSVIGKNIARHQAPADEVRLADEFESEAVDSSLWVVFGDLFIRVGVAPFLNGVVEGLKVFVAAVEFGVRADERTDNVGITHGERAYAEDSRGVRDTRSQTGGLHTESGEDGEAETPVVRASPGVTEKPFQITGLGPRASIKIPTRGTRHS